MLNVSYKNKIGHFTQTENREDGVRKFRIDICHANCLCAMMYFYKNAEGENIAQVVSFFTDIKHVKRCIKDGMFNHWSNFVFNAKECDAEMWKFIRLLANNGKKVTIK